MQFIEFIRWNYHPADRDFLWPGSSNVRFEMTDIWVCILPWIDCRCLIGVFQWQHPPGERTNLL